MGTWNTGRNLKRKAQSDEPLMALERDQVKVSSRVGFRLTAKLKAPARRWQHVSG